MILLGAVIVVLVLWHVYDAREWRIERQRLLNAVVARNAHELVGLDSASNAKPRKPKEREPLVEQVGA